MSGTVQESFDRAWREGIQSKTQQKDQERSNPSIPTDDCVLEWVYS